jgi:hypothetical protein
MNNYRLYETIKNDLKRQLNEYSKIIQYNEQDMDFHETMGFDKKLQLIRDKLKQKKDDNEIRKEIKNAKPVQNKMSIIHFENENREEFRNYNIFIPKIEINQTNDLRSTFVGNITGHHSKEDEPLEIKSTDNGLGGINFTDYKTMNETQKFDYDSSFFINRYIEASYRDKSEFVPSSNNCQESVKDESVEVTTGKKKAFSNKFNKNTVSLGEQSKNLGLKREKSFTGTNFKYNKKKLEEEVKAKALSKSIDKVPKKLSMLGNLLNKSKTIPNDKVQGRFLKEDIKIRRYNSC